MHSVPHQWHGQSGAWGASQSDDKEDRLQGDAQGRRHARNLEEGLAAVRQAGSSDDPCACPWSALG